MVWGTPDPIHQGSSQLLAGSRKSSKKSPRKNHLENLKKSPQASKLVPKRPPKWSPEDLKNRSWSEFAQSNDFDTPLTQKPTF